MKLIAFILGTFLSLSAFAIPKLEDVAQSFSDKLTDELKLQISKNMKEKLGENVTLPSQLMQRSYDVKDKNNQIVRVQFKLNPNPVVVKGTFGNYSIKIFSCEDYEDRGMDLCHNTLHFAIRKISHQAYDYLSDPLHCTIDAIPNQFGFTGWQLLALVTNVVVVENTKTGQFVTKFLIDINTGSVMQTLVPYWHQESGQCEDMEN